MNGLTVLKSKEDDSVNFVSRGDAPGFFEARYVRRRPDYFVAYLSSQSGCAEACRMCHLTATGQSSYVDALPKDFLSQAQRVLEWYDQSGKEAKAVHFNFMARGEPLKNPWLEKAGDKVLEPLAAEALSRSLFPRYLISTIMPVGLRNNFRLTDSFKVFHPEIYYSIYGVDEKFRKRWLPSAMPVNDALLILKDYQEMTSKIPKLHWAFIRGQNDSAESMARLCEAVNSFGLRVDVNIVRYNPYSEKYGEESSEDVIYRNAEILKSSLLLSNVQIVKRVGFDIKASCGMFVDKEF